MNFKRNVGRNDKNIRIAIGAVLLLIGLFKSFWLALIGAIVLTTGLISFCGLYTLIGMNTASKKEQESASNDLSDRASENFDDFKKEAQETASELKEKAEDVYDAAEEKASELADSAKEKYNNAKDSINKKS